MGPDKSIKMGLAWSLSALSRGSLRGFLSAVVTVWSYESWSTHNFGGSTGIFQAGGSLDASLIEVLRLIPINILLASRNA